MATVRPASKPQRGGSQPGSGTTSRAVRTTGPPNVVTRQDREEAPRALEAPEETGDGPGLRPQRAEQGHWWLSGIEPGLGRGGGGPRGLHPPCSWCAEVGWGWGGRGTVWPSSSRVTGIALPQVRHFSFSDDPIFPWGWIEAEEESV